MPVRYAIVATTSSFALSVAVWSSAAMAQSAPTAEPASCAEARSLALAGRRQESMAAKRACQQEKAAASRARAAERAAVDRAREARNAVLSAPQPVACPASFSAPKTGGVPEIKGVQLGMSPVEFAAVCCSRRWPVSQSFVAAVANGTEVVPGITTEAPVEPPHLHRMLCAAPDGTLEARFSYPPREARVVQVDFSYAPGRAPTPLFIVPALQEQYGSATANLEPEPNGQGGVHNAMEWSLAKRPNERNCLNTGEAADRKAFQPVLPPTGPCATSLLWQMDYVGETVTSESLELVNVRELADAFDQHITFLNGERGTKLPEHPMTRILTWKPAPKRKIEGSLGERVAGAMLKAQQGIFASGDLEGAFSAAMSGFVEAFE
ncbi:MAG TPA: hypothetical protein VHU40_08315, partial [Polyangia bacterium]|nr:hypothetical protein [Polyangia bacterium]